MSSQISYVQVILPLLKEIYEVYRCIQSDENKEENI